MTSPYGPSPHKQSPSPHRPRREDGHTEDVVSTFDASVDGRAVWSVTSHRTKTKTEGFREIQIQHTRDLSVCDSGHTSASNNNKHTRDHLPVLLSFGYLLDLDKSKDERKEW